MSKLAVLVLLGLVAVIQTESAWGQVANQYVVQFRDGTLLRMEIDDHELGWQRVASDGTITVEPMPFSKIGELELVVNPVTERVKQIRRWIDQLGHESFKVREQANRDLIEKGGDFLDVIESAQGAADPEVRWRLEIVIRQLKSPSKFKQEQEYDRLRLLTPQGSSADMLAEGDAGEWSVLGRYRGQEVELSRVNVRMVRRGALPTPDFSAELRPGERLTADDLDRFPEDRTQVDFDFFAAGQETNSEMDVGDAYLDKGVRLQTSLADGYIGIFDFKVNGSQSGVRSSGGRVRGSSEADYQGITTITFCVPGQPEVPATVHYFGCYLAIVEENGTVLRYFDPQGRMINELSTSRRPWDFVGFYSPTPISRIEIYPTEEDENYAFDDLLFDIPRAQADAGDPNLFSLVTNEGERLQAKALQIGEENLTLKEMTVGVSEVSIPKSEVAVLIPQFFGAAVATPPPSNWIRLSGGSILRAKLDGQGAAPLLFPDRRLGIGDLQAVWHESQPELNRSLAFGPAEFPAVIFQEAAIPLKNLGFGPAGFQAEVETPGEESYSYDSMDLILISKEQPLAGSAGLLRTADDQLLIIDQQSVVLEDWDQGGVRLSLQGGTARLDWKQIRSLRLPREVTP